MVSFHTVRSCTKVVSNSHTCDCHNGVTVVPTLTCGAQHRQTMWRPSEWPPQSPVNLELITQSNKETHYIRNEACVSNNSCATPPLCSTYMCGSLRVTQAAHRRRNAPRWMMKDLGMPQRSWQTVVMGQRLVSQRHLCARPPFLQEQPASGTCTKGVDPLSYFLNGAMAKAKPVFGRVH